MEDVGVNSRMGYSCTQVLSADNKSNTYLWFNSLFSISSFATTNGVDDVGAVGMGYSHLHPACSRPNVSPYKGDSLKMHCWPFMSFRFDLLSVCLSVYLFLRLFLCSFRLFRLMCCSKFPYNPLFQLLKEPAPAVRIRDNRNGHRWLYTGRSLDTVLKDSL